MPIIHVRISGSEVHGYMALHKFDRHLFFSDHWLIRSRSCWIMLQSIVVSGFPFTQILPANFNRENLNPVSSSTPLETRRHSEAYIFSKTLVILLANQSLIHAVRLSSILANWSCCKTLMWYLLDDFLKVQVYFVGRDEFICVFVYSVEEIQSIG